MTQSAERWREIDTLFDRALDLPAAQRRSFVADACGEDAALRNAVERLLAAHERTGDFLDQPAPAFAAAFVADDDIEPDQLTPGTRIGAYTVIDAVGRGGMGAVYRAQDERLDRIVALKIVTLTRGADEVARKRFIAEARLASALDHPGIGVVHDIGETGDGHLFLAMGYYDGETLAAKLARGPLPNHECLHYAVQIADALAAAHRKGIVHRDIKPANVIITSDGVAKIVDFGIAQLTGTSVDSVRGTLAYMSPEQLRGDAVDARTDVWSFGIMLHEMVSGAVPFRSGGAATQMRAISNDAPPALPTSTRRAARVNVVVRHCLEKRPDDRFPDAGALVTALAAIADSRSTVPPRSRLVAACAALVVIATAGAVIARAAFDGDLPVIAVGRVEEFGASNTPPLAGALSDMLATNLARVPRLRVLSNARMVEILAQLNDTSRAAPARAARQAGAAELLEGSLYSRTDGSLRLDLRRVALRDGSVRHAVTVTASDLFELVDRATEQLSALLGLSSDSLRVADVTTTSLVAYRFYEEGLRSAQLGDGREAIRLFEAALAEDSSFAMAAHYQWAMRLELEQQMPVSVRSWLLRLATRAPERERLIMQISWDASLTHAQRGAIADTLVMRYPELPEGYRQLATHYETAGDFTTALRHIQRVIDMDSLGLRASDDRCRACDALSGVVGLHIANDSLAAAERAARDWVRRQPGSVRAWNTLALALLAADRHDEAIAARRMSASLNPADPVNALFPAMVRISAGDFVGADRVLRELADASKPDDVRFDAIWFLAISLRTQGRFEEAVEIMRTAPDIHPARTITMRQHEAQALFESGRLRDAVRMFETAAKAVVGARSIPAQARQFTWNMTHAATVRAAMGDTAVLRAAADDIQRRGQQSYYGRDWRLHHHVRGLLLAARGQHADAAAEFRRAIFSPSVGYTRTNLELARALLALNRPREAVSILRSAFHGPLEASNLYVTRTDLHAMLGRAWEAAGRADSARVHYQRVLDAWRNADPYVHARRDSVRARLDGLRAP
ncbi:MAG TPA: protein kinase [Longimicrobiales bacterium]|nr:protein kinase [Longimicrobiales bacterium]